MIKYFWADYQDLFIKSAVFTEIFIWQTMVNGDNFFHHNKHWNFESLRSGANATNSKTENIPLKPNNKMHADSFSEDTKMSIVY